MKYINSETLIWEYLSKNDIHVGRDQDLVVSRLLDIVHIRIESNHTLPMHYHNRPQNGHQVFCFYRGGNFLLMRENEEIIHNQSSPFYLVIGSGSSEMHSIKNLDKNDLEFICICAPKFEGPREEIHIFS